MASEDTRRSIWHAFTALAKGEHGEVAKSSLKVLTNNIGRALGKDKAEEILEDAHANLSFPKYFSIIEPKLLRKEDELAEPLLTPKVMVQIDKICWMLCEAYYLKNSVFGQGSSQSLDISKGLFKLWKVFNFLAKIDADTKLDDSTAGEAALPIRIDIEEAYRAGSLIRQAAGYDASDCPSVDPDADSTNEKFLCDFVKFISIVTDTVKDLTPDAFSHGLDCVSDEILNDIIKKGYLEKFGNHVTNWKKRWFCLTARDLKYFTTYQERDLKGTIEVCKNFRPESQKPGQHKQFRIKLVTGNRSYELAAADLRSKNEWIQALQKAADHFERGGSFQKYELEEREKQRTQRREKIAQDEFGKSLMREALQEREKRLAEEHEGRLQDKSLLKKREEELEAEKQARLEVEALLAEEAAQLEAERLRLKELEEIRAMLEKLLEDERQAKRDEEIVRNLQAQLLAEEMEKREELERLQAEQDRLLHQEREEKMGLERQRQEQESQLKLTQDQLDRLHSERQMAEQKILEAEEKMKLAEVERQKMQERLRLREMSTSIGLRRPMPTPNPDPFVTHRGKGAFTEADFVKKSPLHDGVLSPSPDSSGQSNNNNKEHFVYPNTNTDTPKAAEMPPYTPAEKEEKKVEREEEQKEKQQEEEQKEEEKENQEAEKEEEQEEQTEEQEEQSEEQQEEDAPPVIVENEKRVEDQKEARHSHKRVEVQDEYVNVTISPNSNSEGRHVSLYE